ncbi:MAG: magnesium transporter [Betaproteobacteria bacterium]|nr:magnesium transporter [Betaproteobacteria bacterium]
MSDAQDRQPKEGVQLALQQVVALLERHKLVEGLVHKQEMPRHDLVETLVHKQHIAELQTKLDTLHVADIAHILEALPLDERLIVWDLVKAEREGEILLEVSEPVREALIASMDSRELVAAAETLDTDELADLAPDLPQDVLQDVFKSLSLEDREQLRAAMSYEDDTVGALMDFDLVTIREDVTLETVLRYLRRLDELPDQTDQIFVVDRRGRLRGALPLKRLLVSDLEAKVATVMQTDILMLRPRERASEAAQAFERYDLITVPVIDERGTLVGRVSVDAVLDYVREAAESERLSLGGLREEEDIFASVWMPPKNRWAWLAINMVTALVASRVISVFEGTIEQLVALAALMPIVAGIGGNSGNQTITMLVRAIALGQVSRVNFKRLLTKELMIGMLNGLVWGGIMGLIAALLYENWSLGLVMTLAMTLNLSVAALFGLMIPMLMHRYGRDPAAGSSVLITALTDSGGFFIFFGLAHLLLM